MTLYEAFNTTNQTQPHSERHLSFVTDISSPSCSIVQSMPWEKRCEYVTNSDECKENIFILDYMDLLYCQIEPRNAIVMMMGVALLLVITAYIFIIMGATADRFFCPSLTVMCKILNINENVGGVTLLAFGNGAPDMFTSFAGLSGESRRLYSDVYGAMLFVSLFVGGCILVIRPFTLKPSTLFLRDILFLIVDVLLVDFCIRTHQSLNFAESIIILALYVVYIIVVLFDAYLLSSATAALAKSQGLTISEANLLHIMESEAHMDMLSRHSEMRVVLKFDDNFDSLYDEKNPPNHNIWGQFQNSLRLIDVEEFKKTTNFKRLYILMNVPFMFLLKMLIPLVDVEIPGHGWSKLLNCAQVVILPSCLCLASVGLSTVFYVPIILLVVVATLPLAFFTFMVSRTDLPPPMHKFFSIFGVVGSIFMIYSCAGEMVSILDTLGVTTNRSNSFLGCTLMAWGNGIGDLISNTALARTGYQRMGFAACFGGPLFNSLLAIGTCGLYKSLTLPDGIYPMAHGTMGENCFVFACIAMFGVLFGIACTNFAARRSIGAFMLTMYALFFAFTLLGELEVIHTYGTDHRLDQRSSGWDEM